jgi:hypothetical protein
VCDMVAGRAAGVDHPEGHGGRGVPVDGQGKEGFLENAMGHQPGFDRALRPAEHQVLDVPQPWRVLQVLVPGCNRVVRDPPVPFLQR